MKKEEENAAGNEVLEDVEIEEIQSVKDDGVTQTQETRRLKDMVRQTLTAGGSSGALASLLGMVKEYAIPLIIFATLIVILLSFRAILLPFILALALVYLMEPIVSFLKRRSKMPRFMSVLLVYISFIGVLIATAVVIVPPFVLEIANFAEAFPAEAKKFRTEQVPLVNQRLQEILKSYLPLNLAPASNQFDFASSRIRNARALATQQSIAFGNAHMLMKHAYSQELKQEFEEDAEGGITKKYSILSPTQRPKLFETDDALGSGWTIPGEKKRGPISIRTGEKGEISIDLNDVSIEVEQVADSKWIVRKSPDLPSAKSEGGIEELFNLEKTLDGLIGSIVSISNQRISSLVAFLQKTVVGIVGAIVGFLLTLMVAAFISIDLPRVMGFFRGVVPKKSKNGYDILLKKLNRGLAGVVRGQLVICVLNGLLTWIGLWFLGVKFSVLLAVIAGILSLIPVFGTIISTIPIVLVGLLDGFMMGLLALLWILLVHGVEAYVLNPKIIGTSAHIHPVIVIFALLAGESAFGIIGALLAIPAASIILTFFDFFRSRAWESEELESCET